MVASIIGVDGSPAHGGIRSQLDAIGSTPIGRWGADEEEEMARSEGPGLKVGPARAVRLLAQVPLALALLLATPSSASASSNGRVVVDLIRSSDTESVMTLLQGSFGEGFTADVVSLDQLVEVGPWPWVYSPTARLEPCTAEPTTTSDITAALASAEELITGLEYEVALTELDLLAASLCASSEPLPVEVTHRIPYLRGLIHFYDGDEAQARESFQRAGEMSDGLEWDTSYSPEPQQLFLLGVGDAVQSATSRLLFPQEGRPERVYIDGQEVGPDAADMAIRGSQHVVQFGSGGGSLTGVLLSIDAPGDIPLFGPDSFREALLSTPDADLGAHAFSVVAQAAAEQGYSEVMVLNDAKWDHCWWANTADQEWKQTTLQAGAELRVVRRHRTAGGVLMGTGGALMAGGAVLAATQFKTMGDMRPEMEVHTSAWEFGIDEYNDRQRLAGVGIGLVAVGAAAMTTGIVLLSKGKAIQAETGVDPRLAFVASPQGAWLGVGGRF